MKVSQVRSDRRLHLGLMLTATGAHFGSWRLPESTPECSFSFDHYAKIAKIASKTGSLGHWTLCGTADSIADTLQSGFEGGAADGFILMPASQPDGIEDFVDMVIPELQRRGLFRSDYESSTLRGNLGLAVPPSK